ncbi:hypothetical protein HZH66_014655 [Vespula vulgaris]|uniref:Uncharacterized protein n=1 Tax=Vespula vulgaris TaxID=7454 RepID=A0A834MPS3_VESVU|nr:hypothetical protein HZH66_014655 [Vespula vulgaris]
MANMIIFSVLVENSRYLEYKGLIIDDLKLNNLTTRIFPLLGIYLASPTNSLEQRPENRSEERNMLVKQSPEDIGTRVGDQTINNIAFACSPRLKTVAQATTYLHQCGLEINPVKSHTIGIMV